MRRIQIFTLFVAFFAVSNAKAQNECTHFLPKCLLKKCREYEQVHDTFIFYQRSRWNAYFFYTKKKQVFLKVYYLNEEAQTATLVCSKKNQQIIRDVIRFAADNFKYIQSVEGSSDLYTKYEQTKIKDSIYQMKIVRGYPEYSHNSNHTCCFIRLGSVQTYNNLHGVRKLSEYDEVAPVIGQFLRLMHLAYSKYSVETIIDR